MGRISKEELARYEGADWMLRLVEKDGLEAAKKELEQRNVRGIPLKVNMSDVKRLYDSERKNLMRCLKLLDAQVLIDELDFDVPMINRYTHRFEEKASCIIEDYVDWEDIQKSVAEETGITIPIGGD